MHFSHGSDTISSGIKKTTHQKLEKKDLRKTREKHKNPQNVCNEVTRSRKSARRRTKDGQKTGKVVNSRGKLEIFILIIQNNTNIAVLLSSAEFWHDCVVGTDDLERPNGRHRQRITDRCRAQRQHGACISQRRSALPHQLSRGACASWRNCCVQSGGTRHSDRSQSDQITRKVSH